MTPENMEYVYSPLEEYNRFFIEFLDCVDIALQGDNVDIEDTITSFLDYDIKDIIRNWLGERYAPFLIFPMNDDDDEFTDEKFTALIAALIQFSKENISREDVVKDTIDSIVDSVEASYVPEPVVEPVPEPVPEAVPEPVVEPVPQPVPEPVPTTIKEAIVRRKTLRIQHRISRGKTRRTHTRA